MTMAPKNAKYKECAIHYLNEMDQHMVEQSNGRQKLPDEVLTMVVNADYLDKEQYHDALNWALDRMEYAGLLGVVDA